MTGDDVSLPFLSSEELVRRRPLWAALSDLFLDNELQVDDYERVAHAIVSSGYSPRKVKDILWQEVFPALEFNLRDVAGEWAGFQIDWLEQRILATHSKPAAWRHPQTAATIQDTWDELSQYLPTEFR